MQIKTACTIIKKVTIVGDGVETLEPYTLSVGMCDASASMETMYWFFKKIRNRVTV